MFMRVKFTNILIPKTGLEAHLRDFTNRCEYGIVSG